MLTEPKLENCPKLNGILINNYTCILKSNLHLTCHNLHSSCFVFNLSFPLRYGLYQHFLYDILVVFTHLLIIIYHINKKKKAIYYKHFFHHFLQFTVSIFSTLYNRVECSHITLINYSD